MKLLRLSGIHIPRSFECSRCWVFSYCQQITHEGFHALTAANQLTDLNLAGSSFASEEMIYLKALTNLKALSQRECNIGDQELSYLQFATRLKSLDLAQTMISDEGLHFIFAKHFWSEMQEGSKPRWTLNSGLKNHQMVWLEQDMSNGSSLDSLLETVFSIDIWSLIFVFPLNRLSYSIQSYKSTVLYQVPSSRFNQTNW